MKAGDRVRLDHTKLREFQEAVDHRSPWSDFDQGVILTKYDKYKSGYGSDHPEGTGITWGVRWDDFDYGDSPTNCHTADEVLLALDDPDEDELAEALASIEQAARNTMSTRRLP